jgi:hypothetical protein
MPRTPSHKLPAAALAALASCLLAACGGTSSANSSASRQAANEQKMVKFAQCLREHGVNASTSGGGGLNVTAGGPGNPANKQSLDAAQSACSRYRPTDQGAAKMSPAERAARVDQIYKFARCMREHGVEVSTQTQGNGPIGIQIKGSGPQNPTFEAAQKACESFMPKPPGGGLTTGPKGGAPSQGSGLSMQSAPAG